MEIAIGLVIIGIGVLIFLQLKGKNAGVPTDYADIKAQLGLKTEEIGQIKADLETMRTERDELSGKNKVMFATKITLDEEIKNLRKEKDDLEKRLAKHDATKEQKEEEQKTTISYLQNAVKALQDERDRVIRQDEEELRQQEEERDRLWKDHEDNVISVLRDLCKKPELAFTTYDNETIPSEFSGPRKPDFLVEFLGQYIIFDAKISKPENLQTYISTQVKDTIKKFKDNDKIYKHIFLVVPAIFIGEVKNHYIVQDGYSFYIISPETIAPILANLKRITTYEFAEQMDPQQRENIVQLIAELDFHINLRNAADIILTKMGTELLQKAQKVDPALAEEVALKKQPMNANVRFAAAELKKIVSNLTAQTDEIRDLVSPSAPVHGKDLKQAEAALGEILFSE